ncbi:MAG: polysaccharide deacetylase [Ruminococcaceae bacterium]|nr:polysaccharide deacetylase [Oscillospiraceae bacterium]
MMSITMRFPNGLHKAFTMSYDDGVKQDVRLVEIMKRYGLKGTFNVNSGLFRAEDADPDSSNRLSEKEVRALYVPNGQELAVHGLLHQGLLDLPIEQVTYEVIRDRANLEDMLGMPVRGMAYAYGHCNDTVVKALEACGIAYSRTTISSQKFAVPTNWLRLEATCHHNNERLFELADEFLAYTPRSSAYPAKLFYLWGHSYEFDWNLENNNWERIEAFAEKIGGHDDVWYATNIEIYDYVQAFGRLRFNLAQTVVENPTDTDVWFQCSGGKRWVVRAGETLRFGE